MVTDTVLRDAGVAAQRAALSVEAAVYREMIDPTDALAGFGRAAARWGEWVGHAVGLGEDDPVSAHLAVSMARSTATCIHGACHRAFDGQAGALGDVDVATLLRQAEREHLAALGTTRQAAGAGELTPGLRDLWTRLCSPTGLTAYAACAAVGGLAPGARAEHAAGLRASLLARRTAMLGAGLANLHRRLMSPALRRGVMGIAGRRERLWRARPEVRLARRSMAGAAPLDRIELVGRVRDTGWVDRPGIPYSFADCGEFEIRVHRRNLAAVGVGVGRWLWARGKVESDGERPVLVTEMEGPGRHAGTVWEDWMADEVRGVYDLWPRVMDIAFEFPRIDRRGGVSDLAERTRQDLPDV